MKKMLGVVCIVLCSLTIVAQAPSDFVIPVKVNTSLAPVSITLQWPANADATSYTIKRKDVSDNAFKEDFISIASITTDVRNATSYTDDNIQAGQLYEYELSGTFSPSLPVTRSVYVCAGINAPAVHKRGSLLLLCDSNIVSNISSGLNRLYEDLVGDGWRVIRTDVTGSSNPADAIWVKSKIQNIYSSVPDLKQILIVGHVPVPYSGNFGPDGHTNHIGAWPADGYYGAMVGNWTDIITSTSVASTRQENKNIPGDGKFDQDSLPPVQLAVGRIDLSNLPVYSMFETDLLNRYFQKNHLFRHGQTAVQKRALIEDNFTSFSEKFSQSAWKSFSSTVGYDNVQTGQYESWLLWPFGYLWSYGAGAGTYTGAGGIGNSGDFVTQSYNTVFTELFGSYFGDWDSQDNYMRSSIASAGNTLACVWGGRPHWFFHNMSAGMPIGYSALLTMNNKGMYKNTGSSNAGVHIALMGDPTLRSNYTKPPQAFFAQANTSTVNLLWTRSNEDSILGYYVYRSSSVTKEFKLLNEEPITSFQFTDATPLNGNNVYMVRTAKMDTIITAGSYTNNSTYVNLSQGLIDSVSMIIVPQTPVIFLDNIIQSSSPKQVVVMGDSSKRYFIGQKNGEIKLYGDDLNFINTYISVPFANEGFFSMAFDPGYSRNKLSYVFYTTTQGDLELARFIENNNGDSALYDGTLFTIPNPGSSRNLGGEIHFSEDGHLFISTGDGDTQDAANNNAQKNQILLGKILRILPDASRPASEYIIPADNPYTNEVFASGLRFPYRWNIDKVTKEIWIGDRGDTSVEEINHISLPSLKGANFGWPCYDGTNSFNTSDCRSQSDYQFPIYNYPSPGIGSSVTGGLLYRGETFMDLKDYYIFADEQNGNIYLSKLDSSLGTYHTTSQFLSPGAISDISEDSDGELYATSLQGGVYRIGTNGPRRYRFKGNGNWSDANNWSLKTIPPLDLPSGSEIIISPANSGECILNVPQTIQPGSKLIVENNKNFRVSGNLTIQ
jgi:glucose/arabinose dehydrogenase